MSAGTGRLRRSWWVARTLHHVGMVRLLRPDRHVRQWRAVRRSGAGAMSGISLSAARIPDRTAVVDERGSLTWSELDEQSDALAVGLLDLAAGRPGPLGVLCRNHRGIVLALAASARAGQDALLLNTGFSGPQLGEVVEREGVRLLVLDEEFLPLVDELRERVPDLVVVLAWTEEAEPVSVDSLLARHCGERPPPVSRPGQVVLLTSGTTGTPKGARGGSTGGTATLAAMFERIPWRFGETVVVAAPVFHAFGFGQVAIACSLGCTSVLRRRFDPEATLGLLREHRAEGLAAVPVMVERIVDLPPEVLDRYPLPHLRFVTTSGSRMRPDAVLAFLDRFGDTLYTSYNSTEVGLITTATPADLRAAPDTAGRPVTGSDVRVVDERGRDLPPGEVGSIVVQGASEFEGYTNGETKPRLRDHMVSGDVGRFDADGRLFVVGRDDDMVVSGGENVFPVEVERCLLEHPGVRECAVVGVKDAEFGERLAAYVVPLPGADVTEQQLREHVRARLAGFKVPREVVLLTELPRNEAGKVLTRGLAG